MKAVVVGTQLDPSSFSQWCTEEGSQACRSHKAPKGLIQRPLSRLRINIGFKGVKTWEVNSHVLTVTSTFIIPSAYTHIAVCYFVDILSPYRDMAVSLSFTRKLIVEKTCETIAKQR